MSSSQSLEGPYEANSPWREMQNIIPKRSDTTNITEGVKTRKWPSESLTDSYARSTLRMLDHEGVILGEVKATIYSNWCYPNTIFLTTLTRKDVSSIPYGTVTTNCDEFPLWYTVGLTVCCIPEHGQLMYPTEYNLAAYWGCIRFIWLGFKMLFMQ
jgi:hypothetical protein